MVGATSGPGDTERARTPWFALLLTLANGFLDAHTYLARGGVFANVHADGRRCTDAWGVHAIWLPAGFLAVTLCIFIIEERN